MRDHARAEREGRLGRMVTRIEDIPWMVDLMEPMLESAEKVETQFSNTLAVNACRLAFEKCRARLTDLQHGRFFYKYSDNSLNLKLCETMQRQMLATSFPAIDLDWWNEPDGREYWRLQEAALARGVEIRRVIIHDGWTPEIDEVARRQREAGVRVKQVHRDRLAQKHRAILGVWDGNCALDLTYNAAGEPIGFRYLVDPPDVAHIRAQFEQIEMLAEDIDQATPMGQDSARGRTPTGQ